MKEFARFFFSSMETQYEPHTHRHRHTHTNKHTHTNIHIHTLWEGMEVLKIEFIWQMRKMALKMVKDGFILKVLNREVTCVTFDVFSNT